MTTKAQLVAVEEIINTPSLLNINLHEAAARATLTEIISRHFPGDGEDTITDTQGIEWIEKQLGGFGINVRQSGQHRQMRYYLQILREEIDMTKQFLHDDRAAIEARKATK